MIESSRGGPPRAGVTESTVEDAALEWLEGLGWKVPTALVLVPHVEGSERTPQRAPGSGDPAERRSVSVESKVCPARSWTTPSVRLSGLGAPPWRPVTVRSIVCWWTA